MRCECALRPVRGAGGAATKPIQASSHSVTQPRFELAFLAPRFWGHWLVMLMIAVCIILPRRLVLKMGSALGDVFYRSNEKRRKIAEINVQMCFPDLSVDQRQRLVRQHYRLYGRALIDYGVLWWGSTARIDSLCTVTGKNILKDLEKAGRPVLLITPHTVAIDMGGALIARLICGVSMMKRAHDPLLTWRLWRGRCRFDAIILMRDQGLRRLVKAIKGGRIAYLIPDEDLGDTNALFSPFFGIPTATVPVVGWLAKLTDAAVVPVFTRMLDNGRYVFDIKPPLSGFPLGDKQSDAATVNSVFEAEIRSAPEQALWTFKWFKTRPDNNVSPYD